MWEVIPDDNGMLFHQNTFIYFKKNQGFLAQLHLGVMVGKNFGLGF
jgi:hypothetical protein